MALKVTNYKSPHGWFIGPNLVKVRCGAGHETTHSASLPLSCGVTYDKLVKGEVVEANIKCDAPCEVIAEGPYEYTPNA